MITVDSSQEQPEKPLRGRARAHVAETGAGRTPTGGETATLLQRLPGRSLIMRLLEDDSEIAPLAVAAIKAGLSANQMFYDKRAKAWSAEPDARTRLAAAQLVLQYMEGLPLQRIESKSMSYDATPRMLDQLTPATIEAMERAIARSRAASKRNVVPPVPVQTYAGGSDAG